MSITPPKVSDSSSVPKSLKGLVSTVTKGALHSPLPWLGGLIVVYLSVPLVAFAIRLSGPLAVASTSRGCSRPSLSRSRAPPSRSR